MTKKTLTLVASLLLAGCATLRPVPAYAAEPRGVIDMAKALGVTAAPLATWTASCGTVDGVGIWTAPACAGNTFPMTCNVSALVGGFTSAATVVVSDKVTGITLPVPVGGGCVAQPQPYVNNVQLSCTVEAGKTIQFTAVVRTTCSP